MTLPNDIDASLTKAWSLACDVPGYMGEKEFRFLGLLTALSSCAEPPGVLVEIGSFKGKSTIALAKIAERLELGPVVSIDPHTSPSETDPDLQQESSSFDEFLRTLQTAAIEKQVEVHRAASRDAARGWNRQIRMLWIDGDHTYAGAKEDFDLFSPHLAERAIVAIHDVLHEFEGPVRVFVEEVLQSDAFGPAGFSGSIGWAQYRPRDGARFRNQRMRLARMAARLIPLVSGHGGISGWRRLNFKFRRAMVLRASAPPNQQHLQKPAS